MPNPPCSIKRSLTLVGLLVFGAARICAQAAPAQSDDHRAVIEVGLAGERGISGSSSSAGGTVAVEFTPIENWLEMESGVTVLHSTAHTEVSVDLLFKKPWRLSATSEFMAGLGPEISHAGAGGGTSLATEVIADWMFWPTKNVGWYLEPSYSFTSLSGGERNVGIAAGLIIGVP